MAEVRQVDPKRFEAVMRLLGEHPDLDVEQLRSAVEAPARRRPRPEPIRPKTAGELVALVDAGVITKTEAKRYLAVPRARASNRR
jgi:hypothetical protein